MSFEMLEFMKSGEEKEEPKTTKEQEDATSNSNRKKGLENVVSIEQKEKAKRILGQLRQAKMVLEEDKQNNYFRDEYDVFDHAKIALHDFYVSEAHMSEWKANTIAREMAEIYKIIEDVDALIENRVYEYTRANVRPDRGAIWGDVTKIVRFELEEKKISPAKIEVILDDLYNRKIEWIREPQLQKKPLPEKKEWDQREIFR